MRHQHKLLRASFCHFCFCFPKPTGSCSTCEPPQPFTSTLDLFSCDFQVANPYLWSSSLPLAPASTSQPAPASCPAAVPPISYSPSSLYHLPFSSVYIVFGDVPRLLLSTPAPLHSELPSYGRAAPRAPAGGAASRHAAWPLQAWQPFRALTFRGGSSELFHIGERGIPVLCCRDVYFQYSSSCICF